MLYTINGKVYDTQTNPLTPSPVLEVISPAILYSDWTPVLTATTAIGSSAITVNAQVWLKSISIVPSADATANGLSVCIVVQAGTGSITYYPNRAQPTLKSLANISAIFNLTLDPPYGMYLPSGSSITLYYAATGGSSTIQMVITGVQQGNQNGYPNGVS